MGGTELTLFELATAAAAVWISLRLLAAVSRGWPAIRALGLDTISMILIPSYLAHAGWLSNGTVERVRTLVEAVDVFGLFIAVLIVGGILGMEGAVLVRGLAKLVLPLTVGSLLAVMAGTLAGTVLGLRPFDALFLLVVPVLGGGLTAGALPLAAGYEDLLGPDRGELLARMLPAVLLGNLAAMLAAALLQLARSSTVAASGLTAEAGPTAENSPASRGPSGWMVAAAGLFLLACYLIGALASSVQGWPAPLVLIVLAALLLFTGMPGTALRSGVQVIYRFCVSRLTGPVLFLAGLLQMPWERFIAGFSWAVLAAILATVGTLALAGHALSRRIGLKPVDSALVTLTRAAMGGTGDVAILSAGRRLDLMPFAQIATRVGGAVTVALALAAAGYLRG